MNSVIPIQTDLQAQAQVKIKAHVPDQDKDQDQVSLASAYRILEGTTEPLLFVANGSRLYDIDRKTATAIQSALNLAKASISTRTESTVDGYQIQKLLADNFSSGHRYIDGSPLEVPALRSLSLNVAQSCNLACSYCYADEGKFGGTARLMDQSTAFASIDRLIIESEPNVDLVIGFMGGEPMLNRDLIYAATRYAKKKCESHQRQAKFSITTNATLINDKDAQFFRDYNFSVAVSIDGDVQANDQSRLDHRGRSSYSAFKKGLDKILAHGGPGHVSARITVKSLQSNLLKTLKHVVNLGVGDAGFAPVQVSPNKGLELTEDNFKQFLDEMIECGQFAKQQLLAGHRFPFSNLETALNEIHRGSHRPYPCGAGAAYLSVNAEGELYACHRLIDQPQWKMGDVLQGSNQLDRQLLLNRKHVDLQLPCKDCWARYLCGGGCYHEVEQRGRPHCDYVRGWLEFCLVTYAELSEFCPDYFINPNEYLAKENDLLV